MYNNYGYNPYGNRFIGVPQPQQMQQPMAQPIQPQPIPQPIQDTRPILSGKQVDSIDVVKAIEYPLDGSVSYFPLTDGSAIVTKQLQMDGTSKMVVFKPDIEKKEEIKYITQEDMKKALNELDFSELDDIKEDIKDLKQELKDLKKKKKED